MSGFLPEQHPLISIIVLCWNSAFVLRHSLNCLKQQTFTDFEIIVLDNGSTDNSENIFNEARKDFRLRVELLNENKGFATANNIGARLARGKWLALLNADAFPETDWLEKLVKAAEANLEYSSFASRQIQFNTSHLLDGVGDSYHITGLAWRRYYNKPVQKYGHQPEEVFSACPAAALFLREDFLQAGGFDEDFFSYFEDVDLGFRLRLAGKKCLYVPDAVVHHVGSASTGKRSDFSVFYGYRNMIWTFVKNMPSPLIWLLLPIHIVTLLFFVIYLSTRGQGKIIFRAVADAIHGLPTMVKKRHEIQKKRRVKTSDLLKIISTGLFEPYLEFAQRNKRK